MWASWNSKFGDSTNTSHITKAMQLRGGLDPTLEPRAHLTFHATQSPLKKQQSLLSTCILMFIHRVFILIPSSNMRTQQLVHSLPTLLPLADFLLVLFCVCVCVFVQHGDLSYFQNCGGSEYNITNFTIHDYLNRVIGYHRNISKSRDSRNVKRARQNI